MSVTIIKNGLADAFYDLGRYGNQHLGIHPGGAMDTLAVQVANALTLNPLNTAALEMHFPAPALVFNQPALIALAGADLSPTIQKIPVPVHQPLLVAAGATLDFHKPLNGARCYLAVHGGFNLATWLGSQSTSLLAQAGGFNGRMLHQGDTICFAEQPGWNMEEDVPFRILPVRANVNELYSHRQLAILPGQYFPMLTANSMDLLLQHPIGIHRDSNRMGYRLRTDVLQLKTAVSAISSAVTRGTIQLLPDGNPVVLMADHQTTGGYPAIAHVISAHLPALAQKKPGDTISFTLANQHMAEQLLMQQQAHLRQLQNACTLRVNHFLQHAAG